MVFRVVFLIAVAFAIDCMLYLIFGISFLTSGTKS